MMTCTLKWASLFLYIIYTLPWEVPLEHVPGGEECEGDLRASLVVVVTLSLGSVKIWSRSGTYQSVGYVSNLLWASEEEWRICLYLSGKFVALYLPYPLPPFSPPLANSEGDIYQAGTDTGPLACEWSITIIHACIYCVSYANQMVILLTTGGTRGVILHPACFTPLESTSSSMQISPSSDGWVNVTGKFKTARDNDLPVIFFTSAWAACCDRTGILCSIIYTGFVHWLTCLWSSKSHMITK